VGGGFFFGCVESYGKLIGPMLHHVMDPLEIFFGLSILAV
jgi:hypothetical protein